MSTLSPIDAYLIARKLARLELPDDLQPSPMTAVLLSLYDKTADDVAKHQFNQHLIDAGLFGQIMSVDVTKPYQPPKPATTEIPMTPLPSDARLTDAMIEAGTVVAQWYHRASAWTQRRSPMTPPHFLQGAVVWLISLAVARRIYLDKHRKIYPHFYYLYVAETSKYAKSTGMDVIIDIVMRTMRHMLLPGTSSPEALFDALAGSRPTQYDQLPQDVKERIDKGLKLAGQRGIILDEYSQLLGSHKKDYMQGFVELLMNVYSSPEEIMHITKGQGLRIIRKPALCIFGATTPAAMARSINDEFWTNGDIPRYLIMYRDEAQPYSRSYAHGTVPEDVLVPLKQLHDTLPYMLDDFGNTTDFAGYEAAIDPDADDHWHAYDKALRIDMQTDDLDERLTGTYSRLPETMLKIALALAAIDSVDDPSQTNVTLGHIALAQQLTETSRENIHRLMPVLNETRDARTQKDIIKLLKHTHMTARELCRYINKPARDIKSALDVLIESGEVTAEEFVVPGNGYKNLRYSLIDGDQFSTA